MTKLKLLLLGGGNGVHCYAGLAGSLPDVEVRVLNVFQDEAAKFDAVLKNCTLQINFCQWERTSDKVIEGKPDMITKDPSLAVPDSDMIVFMVPAFAHAQYFEIIAPYLRPGMIICGLPGGAGWNFQAVNAFKEKTEDYYLMSFSTLPWACRTDEFGKRATVKSAKEVVWGGSQGTPKQTVLGMSPEKTLQYTLLNKTKCELKGHLLGDCLAYGNAYIHPCIEYGSWFDWDGKPVDEAPDFYHGVNECAANTVDEVCQEALAIRSAIESARPDVNMSQVFHKYESYCNTYDDDTITDKSTLYTIFHSHKGYTGIKHPMVQTSDGKLIPDFKYRYFTEDIPFGLVVFKGMALILGVATPTIDKIITWAQNKMGKEYLVNNQLVGKDLQETRCPQRYGITTLEGMLGEFKKRQIFTPNV